LVGGLLFFARTANAMSAIGPKRTRRSASAAAAFGGKADTAVRRLTDLYIFLQHGTTRSKTLAYEIDVGFEFKKQVRVTYWHANTVRGLFDTLQIGLKYVEL
jgi:hypothetical protein